jgi:hypothetical protein
VKPPNSGARRAVAGLALTAAGMLYSRLGGRRRPHENPPPQPEPPVAEPVEADPSPDELKRARSELSEELARRAARADS